ncbi:sensor histidine kinase [Flavicella sp.]|uniref:tetratricopeptide repeat-containing sensor histidine kinase n=1 Tax=Flavicella sp. TaxID=2957742 RepID=UPI00260F587A|nr:sensor histidine kinase [Flavicella sp.]MDG1805440.1 sensor histidine kinase [Flavicella sp.]
MKLHLFIFLSLIIYKITFCQNDINISSQNTTDSALLQLEDNLKRSTNDSLKTNALIALGEYHISGDFKKVSNYLEEALNLAKKHNNQTQIATAYADLGIMERRKSDYPKAIAYYLKSKTIFTYLNDKANIAALDHNLGVLYRYLEDYDSSIKSYKNAISILLNLEDKKEDLAKSYNMLGVSFRRSDQLDSAKTYYEKAKNIFTQIGSHSNIYRVNGNLAVLNSIQNNYAESLILNFENLKYYQKTNNNASICGTLYNISVDYSKLKNYKKALAYCDQTIAVAKAYNFKSKLKSSYWKKSEIQQNLHQYKDAYENYKIYKKYSDSLLNKESIQKIQAVELNYKFNQEKLKDSLFYVNEKNNSESKIKILTGENKIKNQWILFGSLGFISLLIILYLYKTKKFSQKKRYLQELYSRNLIKSQENEKTKIARELHDSIGQKLMLLTKGIKNTDNEKLYNLADKTLEELREISKDLHPEIIERIGVTTSIKALISEFDDNTELFFTFDSLNIDPFISKETGLHIYRILQESLSNIVKHANAKSVYVSILKKSSYILIVVKDNGIGFDFKKKLKNSDSLGMKTLKERAKVINGNIKILSIIGKGTKTTLLIPVKNEI